MNLVSSKILELLEPKNISKMRQKLIQRLELEEKNHVFEKNKVK